MSITAYYRYEAVRYSPIHSKQYPFQIVTSVGKDLDVLPEAVVVEISLEEAKDLQLSLERMIKGLDNV